MKPINLITILAAAASSAATPVAHVDEIEPSTPPHTKKLLHAVSPFRVTDFVAMAVVLSHRVVYNFNVQVHPEAPILHCFYLGTTLSESLAPTEETWCVNATDADLNPDDDDSESFESQSSSSRVRPRFPIRQRRYPNPGTRHERFGHGNWNETIGQVSFQWKNLPTRSGSGSGIDQTLPPPPPQQEGNDTDDAELIIIRRVPDSKSGTNVTITDEGVYHVAAKDIPILGTRPFEHQVYTGPKNFTVRAFRFLTG